MGDNSLERRGAKHTSKGKKDEVVGRVQRAAGDLTGNKRLKAKGTMHEAKGNARQGIGRAERKASDALERNDDRER